MDRETLPATSLRILISFETLASPAAGRPSGSRLVDDSHLEAWALCRYCFDLAASPSTAFVFARQSSRAFAWRRRLPGASLPSSTALRSHPLARVGLRPIGSHRPSHL